MISKLRHSVWNLASTHQTHCHDSFPLLSKDSTYPPDQPKTKVARSHSCFLFPQLGCYLPQQTPPIYFKVEICLLLRSSAAASESSSWSSANSLSPCSSFYMSPRAISDHIPPLLEVSRVFLSQSFHTQLLPRPFHSESGYH